MLRGCKVEGTSVLVPDNDFIKALNERQYEAVTAGDGPVLVLAAAGTGKTRTLVYRVAHLVGCGVPSDRILLLTFTNRAAEEMLMRARKLAGSQVGGLWGGTFHHMSNRILRKHAEKIGRRTDYTIMDQDDSRKLVRSCVADLAMESGEMPKPEVLQGIFSSAVNRNQGIPQTLEEKYSRYGLDAVAIERIFGRYGEKKKDLNLMDFDDLLVLCYRLMTESPDVLAEYQEKFMHVLVDEYQDTNILQSKIVDAIGGRNRNVFVVGDDFQSIYSWRGADFRNIMTFPERYGDAKVYVLEENYRSIPGILDVANVCIAGNPDQFQKTLRAVRSPGRKPVVAMIADGQEQARYVVNAVQDLVRAGRKLSDIAVLYRAHFHAMELQIELAHRHVPHVVMSGVRFFEQAHIKDACCFLRMIQNPGDGIAFRRIMGLLPGVGQQTAERVWNAVKGKTFSAGPEAEDAVLRVIPPRARDSWKNICDVFKEYREDENLRDDAGEIVTKFVERFYERYLVDTYDNFDRRLEDLREMVLYTARFESVEQFLGDIALLTNLDAEHSGLGAGEGGDSLRLSTVHQAKGREWSAVIVLWANEGMFPSSRTLEESGDDSEERRLFYVAVTRAKDDLRICVPRMRHSKNGGIIPYVPSRFVAEIPRGLVELQDRDWM